MLLKPGAVLLLLAALATTVPAQTTPLRVVDTSLNPLTLHPHRSFDPNSDVIISQVFEGLIDYDTQGELVPKLALAWRRQSPTRYRFWLREGVTFHNGEPFEAEAVRFSLERQFNRAARSANSWLFDPDFHAKVVDRYTVDLITGQPDARLPYTLPMFVKIIPPRYWREVGDDGLARHPVGTGPYRFVSWEQGRLIQLEAYPHYWRPDLPRIKSVVFLFRPQSELVGDLLAGQVDLITKVRGNDTLRIMAAPNTKIIKHQVASVFWAAMKNFDCPFADRRVRQAMNYAVNKAHLIQYVDKGNALSVPTMTTPVERDYNTHLQPYPFDPSRAARLLAEAGYPQGFTVRVLVSEEAGDMIRAIRSQLQQVDVTLDLSIVPREEYLRQTLVPKLETGRPKFDGEMVVWLTPNPTLDAFFNPAVIFCSQSPYSIMNAPVFDRLYFSFVKEIEPERRRESLFRLQDLMFSEAYGIYTSQLVRTYGLHRNLVVEIHPSGMLVGDTLAEAYWQNPGSPKPEKPQWPEARPSGDGSAGEGNETGDYR
ncbi:MAG: ABC transporter substrate-binding protein [Thermodesulfobacteriota bacterium]